MKRFLILFFGMFLTFNIFAQTSYKKIETTLENAADVVRSLTTPAELEVSGVMMPLSKSDFGDLVSEIRTQETSIKLNLAKVEGLKEIESKTFKNCKNLISVILPDSVTYIGSGVFEDCCNLTSVVIGKNVTSIEGSVFAGNCNLTKFEVSVENKNYSTSVNGKILYNKDKTTLVAYPSANGEFVVPDSVIKIGSHAFNDCINLTSVKFSDSVTHIDNYAFNDCINLTSVILPDSVRYVGEYAFGNCSNLASVKFSDSVTHIDNYAFNDCINLTSVILPDSVRYVGEYAFGNCSNLASVVIGKNVTSIEGSAFVGNCNLTKFEVSVENENYSTPVNGKILYNKDKTTLVAYPSANGEIVIPDSVTEIGSSAFEDCSNLTSVIIPDSMTEIGCGSFEGCSNLVSVIIPDNVTKIGDCAFEYCSNLTTVTLSDSVTYIGCDVFLGCENLKYNEYDNCLYLGNSNNPYFALIKVKDSTITSCKIDDKTKLIAKEAFEYCFDVEKIVTGDGLISLDFLPIGSALKSITMGNHIASIGAGAFYDCGNLTSVVIPDSVTSIGYKAFYDCEELASVIIPDSVTFIGDSAFYNCKKLVGVMIPDNVTSIGYKAFYDCEELASVIIPDSVTYIGKYAFGNCGNLTSVVIGKNVTSIEGSAFAGNCNLTKFEVSVENENYSTPVNGKILYNKDKTTLVAYPSANGEIVIPDSVTEIGSSAFEDCSNLTSRIIPNSVVCIGENAFSGCRNLKSVIIPDSVTKIGSWAFEDCNSLVNVKISDSVVCIEEGTFSECESLTNLIIPDNVTKIGDYAFEYCSNLTNVMLPDSITSIGDVFLNCDNLKYNEYDNCLYLGNNNNPYLVLVEIKNTDIVSYRINSTTKIVMSGAFYKCSNLKNITIPDSVIFIGDGVFLHCANLTKINVSINNKNFSSSDDGKILYNKDKTKLIVYPSVNGEFVIPDSVTEIGSGAFANCINLTSITIPDSVVCIGESAFYNCGNLENVNYKGTKEQWEQINIDFDNEYLTNATINYNYRE